MADLTQCLPMLKDRLIFEEGIRLAPYLCDAGVPTIGVGATEYLDGRKVTLRDPPITKEQAMRMLDVDAMRYIHEVNRMVGGVATNHQLVELTVCGYNIGLPSLELKSSMMKLHKMGDYIGAANAFKMWDKYRPHKGAPLQVHPALHARRLREAAGYATPDGEVDSLGRMPQAAEPETALAKSPTMNTGGAMAGVGAAAAAINELAPTPRAPDPVAAIAKAGEHASTVSTSMQSIKALVTDALPIPAGWLLPGVLVIAGGFVMYRRWRTRQRGAD